MKYRFLESFKEYVLVSQKRPEISSFFRKEPKGWVEDLVEGLDETLYLPSLDISINLADVYKGVKF